MRIDIPPASIISKEKLGLAGFAATWNVGIGVWTASAIAAGSLAAAAFSIPFWAAGKADWQLSLWPAPSVLEKWSDCTEMPGVETLKSAPLDDHPSLK